jgi:hypothetical protein
MSVSTQTRMQELRTQLIRLHKILLDSERIMYEKKHGTIPTTGQLLHLVMFDPWFDWLHRISEIVVQIDELMEDKDASLDEAYTLIGETRNLFQAGGGDVGEFMERYRAVLQREPAAVLGHAEVQKLLFADS